MDAPVRAGVVRRGALAARAVLAVFAVFAVLGAVSFSRTESKAER